MQWLNSTGIAVSLFFILFILGKKNRKRADYLLVCLNLLLIIFLVLDILVRERITTILFFLQSFTPNLLIPLFILFALEILQEDFRDNRYWLILFTPATISFIFLIYDLFLLHQYDEKMLQKMYDEPTLGYHLMYKGTQVFSLVAMIWLIKRLRKYSQQIKASFSFIDPIQLNWLNQSTWAFLSIAGVAMLIFIISNLQLLPVDIDTAYSIVSLAMVLALFYISFHGIRQYTVAEYYGKHSDETILFESPPQSVVELPEKYKTSSLTSAEQEAIYQSLLQLFENRNLFLEPKLQLQEVADLLSITTHNLSQTINSITSKPFYDFVNGYRVKHLQKLLADSSKKKFTILALGMDSGFNSKASLNRIFKEQTGLSPKEYQLRNLPE